MKFQILLAASFLLLSGCGESRRAQAPSGDLTLATTIPIGDVVPFSSRVGLGANLIDLLHQPLIHLSNQGGVVPGLAKKAGWEGDGTRLRVLLDEHLTEDVQYTFDYLKKLPIPEFTEGLKNLERLEKSGPGEIVFHLKRFDRVFPFILSQIPILSSDSKKTSGDFLIAAQKEGEVVLERKIPSASLVNRIVVRQIPSSRRIVRETVAGSVDMSFLTDDKTGLTLQDLPNLNFGELKSSFLYFALVNRNNPDLAKVPWKEITGRIDRDDMIRQLETTGLEAATAPVQREATWSVGIPSFPKSSSERPTIAPGQRRLALFYLDLQPIVGRIALLLKRHASEVGIEFDVKQLSPAEFQKRILVEKDFDLVLLPYAIKDPLSSNYFMFHSAEGNGIVNLSGYKNLEVDKHLEVARYEYDETKAKAAFQSAIAAMVEDPPGIFLFWLKTPILYRKSCTGFKFNTNEFFSSLKDVRCEPSAVN